MGIKKRQHDVSESVAAVCLEETKRLNKVLFIVENAYFFASHVACFGVDKMLNSGLSVEIWSLADWKYGREKHEDVIPGTYAESINIEGKETFDINVQRISGDNVLAYIYPYHAYDTLSFYVRKALKENGIPFVNLSESPNANNGTKIFYVGGISKGIRIVYDAAKRLASVLHNGVKKLIYFNDTAAKSKYELRKSEFFGPLIAKSQNNLFPTRLCTNRIPQPLEMFSKRKIYLNSYDYSKILAEECASVEELKGKEYALFIDQAITQYVPLPGEAPIIKNSEIYWNELNSFFDKFEEETGLEVVIAMHPKSVNCNGYGNRKLVIGDTCGYVKGASIVINFYSTAINFGIWYNKKIVLLYSEQINDNHWRDVVVDYHDKLKSMLNTEITNISIPTDSIKINSLDKASRDRFVDLYMVSDEGQHDLSQSEYLLKYATEYFSDACRR